MSRSKDKSGHRGNVEGMFILNGFEPDDAALATQRKRERISSSDINYRQLS